LFLLIAKWTEDKVLERIAKWTEDKVLERSNKFKATIIRTSLSHEDKLKLKAAFGAGK